MRYLFELYRVQLFLTNSFASTVYFASIYVVRFRRSVSSNGCFAIHFSAVQDRCCTEYNAFCFINDERVAVGVFGFRRFAIDLSAVQDRFRCLCSAGRSCTEYKAFRFMNDERVAVGVFGFRRFAIDLSAVQDRYELS